MSSRVRYLLSVVVLLASSFLVAGAAARLLVDDDVEARVAAELVREVEQVQLLVQQVGQPAGASSDADLRTLLEDVARRDAGVDAGRFVLFDGTLLASSPQPPADLAREPALVERVAALDAPLGGELDTAAGPARYLAVPLLAPTADTAPAEVLGTLVVARFTQAAQDRADALVRRFWSVLLLILVVASALAYLVSTRLLTGRPHPAPQAPGPGPAPAPVQPDVLGDVAHALRTPLTAARGLLEAAEARPRRRPEVGLALVELARTHRLVDDLQLLSTAASPDFLRLRTVRLDALVESVLAKAAELGDRRWTLDAADPVVVEADPERLEQALDRVLRNAVEHSDPGDVVALGVARVAAAVAIWVRDEGRGIEAGEAVRVRAVLDGRSASHGKGAGLEVVRAVVVAHGGSAELDLESGQGATFRLVLPVAGPADEGSGDEGLLTKGS